MRKWTGSGQLFFSLGLSRKAPKKYFSLQLEKYQFSLFLTNARLQRSPLHLKPFPPVFPLSYSRVACFKSDIIVKSDLLWDKRRRRGKWAEIEKDFFRTRSKIWASIKPGRKIGAEARLYFSLHASRIPFSSVETYCYSGVLRRWEEKLAFIMHMAPRLYFSRNRFSQ